MILITISAIIVPLIPARAETVQEGIINCDRDTYVAEYYPTTNYGNVTVLIAGYIASTYLETYLHFNLAGRPAQFDRAYLSFETDYPTGNMTVWRSADGWTEDGMAWVNRTSKITTLGYILGASTATRTFDLTSWMTLAEITICFSQDGTIGQYMYTNSRESATPPKIVFERDIEPGSVGIDTIFMSVMIIASLVIGIIAVIAHSRHRSRWISFC